MALKYQTVLLDFDGVLNYDFFYASLKKDYPLVYNFIEECIFGHGPGVADKWMRGQLTSERINWLINENTGLDYQKLYDYLVQSIKQMKLEIRLLDLACDLQKKGTSVALVTNNMDIFNEVTIPYHNLDKIFPVIVNSCDHGFLKHEEGGRLFDIALQKLKQDSFKKALLIDDSAKVRKVFEDKGGTTFAYTVYENFEPWARENLCY